MHPYLYLVFAILFAALGFGCLVVNGNYQGDRPAWGIAGFACWLAAGVLGLVQVGVWVKVFLVDRG